MWRAMLQRFPQYPHWCLVKERRCVYRMGSPGAESGDRAFLDRGQTGKKLACRVTPGGLQAL